MTNKQRNEFFAEQKRKAIEHPIIEGFIMATISIIGMSIIVSWLTL